MTLVMGVSAKKQLLAEIEKVLYEDDNAIFEKELLKRKEAMGVEVNFNSIHLDLSEKDILVLITIHLTSSLGSNTYNALSDIVTDQKEMLAIINHLTRSELIQYSTIRGSLYLSHLGSIVLEIIEENDLYSGFFYESNAMMSADLFDTIDDLDGHHFI